MISTRKSFRSPGEHTRLFEPDTVLPVQLYDSMQRPLTPEKRLVIALLADALNCFQRYHIARRRQGWRDSTEAERWFMSADRDWPFSFENICDVLSIEAHMVRCALRTWRERQEALNGDAVVEEIATVRTLRRQWGQQVVQTQPVL